MPVCFSFSVQKIYACAAMSSEDQMMSSDENKPTSINKMKASCFAMFCHTMVDYITIRRSHGDINRHSFDVDEVPRQTFAGERSHLKVLLRDARP